MYRPEPTRSAIGQLLELYLAKMAPLLRAVIQLDIVEMRVSGRSIEQCEIARPCRDPFAGLIDLFEMQQAMVARPMNHEIPTGRHARTRRRAFSHLAEMDQRFPLAESRVGRLEDSMPSFDGQEGSPVQCRLCNVAADFSDGIGSLKACQRVQ
jgi:hypothetical protein